MERLRRHLPALGITGLLLVCCGAHLLVVAAIWAGVGAALLGSTLLGPAPLGPAPLGPAVGVAALLSFGLAAALVARLLLRLRRRATQAACCETPSAVPCERTGEASAP